MRCAAGDLAIVTSPPEPFLPLLGRPVRVLTHVVIDGEDCWELEEPQEFVFRAPGVWTFERDGREHEIRAGTSVLLRRAPDSWLTPLRGHGTFDTETVAEVIEAARREPAEV